MIDTISRLVWKASTCLPNVYPLPRLLRAYPTSILSSTEATPYSLVYGMEVVLAIEVEIPSLQILLETELEEAEWDRSWYDQLNFIE